MDYEQILKQIVQYVLSNAPCYVEHNIYNQKFKTLIEKDGELFCIPLHPDGDIGFYELNILMLIDQKKLIYGDKILINILSSKLLQETEKIHNMRDLKSKYKNKVVI